MQKNYNWTIALADSRMHIQDARVDQLQRPERSVRPRKNLGKLAGFVLIACALASGIVPRLPLETRGNAEETATIEVMLFGHLTHLSPIARSSCLRRDCIVRLSNNHSLNHHLPGIRIF